MGDVMEYGEKIIQQVWEHGRAVSDQDSNEWRQDQCGAWIRRGHYGHENSEFGWQIHSILPGETGAEHLRPFHYQNTFNVSNGQTHCHITADRIAVNPTAHIDQLSNKPV
ncbi:MAG: hypothetical protein RRB22_01920 [Gammaproteobacteria bacterium]|nr:hypothetical protein [Gammaproteobacteria bacterium]